MCKFEIQFICCYTRFSCWKLVYWREMIKLFTKSGCTDLGIRKIFVCGENPVPFCTILSTITNVSVEKKRICLQPLTDYP